MMMPVIRFGASHWGKAASVLARYAAQKMTPDVDFHNLAAQLAQIGVDAYVEHYQPTQPIQQPSQVYMYVTWNPQYQRWMRWDQAQRMWVWC